MPESLPHERSECFGYGGPASHHRCESFAISFRTFFQAIKNPDRITYRGFVFRCLTMTYSHMGMPHTTIGAEPFHD